MRKIDLKINSRTTLLFITPILSLILFAMSYFIFSSLNSSKDENNLTNFMNDIEDVNNICKDFLDNGNITVDKALTSLPNMRSSLYDIAVNIGNIDYLSTPNHTNEYINLSKGVNENILLLDQLYAMLSNPHGKDLDLAGENLKIYRDTANTYYNLVKYKNSTFSLGISMDSLINETLSYCISSNNAKKIEEIKALEAEQFLTTINELMVSMDKLIINYYEKVIDCRSNKLTYELLISKIDDTLIKMTSVKNVLTQMPIPNEFLSIYNSFSEIVNLYDKYVFDVKYAIVTESVRRDKPDITEDYMDSLYESSNKTLEDVQKKYKTFTKEYNKVKDN